MYFLMLGARVLIVEEGAYKYRMGEGKKELYGNGSKLDRLKSWV